MTAPQSITVGGSGGMLPHEILVILGVLRRIPVHSEKYIETHGASWEVIIKILIAMGTGNYLHWVWPPTPSACRKQAHIADWSCNSMHYYRFESHCLYTQHLAVNIPASFDPINMQRRLLSVLRTGNAYWKQSPTLGLVSLACESGLWVCGGQNGFRTNLRTKKFLRHPPHPLRCCTPKLQ